MAERTILNSVSTIDVYNTSLNVSLNISVNDASVTHSLAIKRGDTTITTSTFGALSVGTQTKIVSLTSAQRTAILNAMPDVASFNATYELTSLNNGVAVGTPSAASAVIKLSNGYPTVADFTWADTNPKTLAMTGDSHYIIEGESDLYFYNVSATPYTGASIAQYILGDGLSDKNLRTTTGGTIHYGTVAPIYAFDPESIGDIFVLAQDTRRREKSKSSTRTGWSYYDRPWNSSVTVTRNASDASLIDIHLSGKFHTVNGLNWMTASFKYKLSSESTYSTDISLPVTTSGNSYSCDAIGLTGLNSSAFSEASQYDIVVTASDALHDNSQSFVLPSISPMIAFRDDAVGFGVVPQGTKRVEIAQDWSLVANGNGNIMKVMPFSWTSRGTVGTAGYARIAMVRSHSWSASTIEIKVMRLVDATPFHLYLQYKNVASDDPDIASFLIDGSASAFAFRESPSLWGIYVQKASSTDYIDVSVSVPYYEQSYGGLHEVVYQSEYQVSSIPSGAVMATPVPYTLGYNDAKTLTFNIASGSSVTIKGSSECAWLLGCTGWNNTMRRGLWWISGYSDSSRADVIYMLGNYTNSQISITAVSGQLAWTISNTGTTTALMSCLALYGALPTIT